LTGVKPPARPPGDNDGVLDVVVIGSGYGGSAIAARLSPHRRVLVVERGRRWTAGEFPRGVVGLGRAYMSRRNPTGLWAMRLGEGTGNAFASAVGGSSVVNYGITAAPEPDALAGWPISGAELEPYVERAHRVLGASPNPIRDELGDTRFIDEVEPGRRVDLENTIDWNRCDQCGRCVPGCNRGAKRSLDRTYLAMAMAAGAELRTETVARTIAPDPRGGWIVELCRNGEHRCERVPTREVVLACGTLGTLDLLWRSRAQVPVGAMFGRRMSMNGDGLAFLYDTNRRISSHSGAPISTSARIPFRDPDGIRRWLMVMSGRVPMAAMRFTGAALAALAEVIRDRATRVAARAWRRRLRDLFRVDGEGALSRSFMYKLDGQDSSRGRARFTDAGAVIDWPDYNQDPVMRFAEERLRGWAALVGGTVIPNVAGLPGMRSFSVHPLGGCRLGRDIDDGVVDAHGRVFDPEGGVYPGLRVADGSVVPSSLGVPPSLTIAALAERTADHMLRAPGAD
jgi:cholesterol oxidase